MKRKDALEHLTGCYNQLTKSGKKVADYIFANKVAAQYLSITALAEECGVAEATIFRFCKTLGYDGYNDFKLALAKAGGATAGGEQGLYGEVLPEDSITSMCKKLYSANVTAMLQTLNLVDEMHVDKAVGMLQKAGRVCCFGQGGSMVIAMEAWARFITVSPKFLTVEDSHLQAMAASLLDENDVVMFFSYSGATRDMQDVLRVAKERKAKVILVTHFAKCPASVFADAVLLCGSKEGPLQSGSIQAKVALLFIIDILFTEYCRREPETSVTNKELTANAIANKLL